MMTLLTILAAALLNRIAGMDIGPRVVRLGLCAVGIGGLSMIGGGIVKFTPDIVNATILAFGFVLWRIPGWDMMAIHGRIGSPKCKPVTWLTEEILGPIPATEEERKDWGMLWMALRGLFVVPTAVALAVINNNAWLALLGLLGLLQGPCYRIPGMFPESKWSGPAAELLTGAFVWGLLIVGVSWLT